MFDATVEIPMLLLVNLCILAFTGIWHIIGIPPIKDWKITFTTKDN